ncbi:MAG: SulP family inorganic anion transporter [Candidatus Nanopelagicales bacterium]
MAGYRRAWLARDAIAGITIAAIAIPGQIAVAKVAGMPPTTGLWACIAAGLVGFLFIANRFLWVGADSTTAPLVIAGLSLMAAPASTQYVQLAVTLALLVGVALVVVALAKMTWMADLLSRTVVAGFMAGVATIIVIGQLPALLGIPPGGTHTVTKLGHVLASLGQINPASALIGIISLAALPLFTVLNRRLPGALLVVALATLATAALSLTRFDVEVLGPLQSGLPQWVWPDLSLDALRGLLPTALSITLLSIAQSAATSRSSADAGGFSTSLRSDFVGVGASNLASAGVGSFSVDVSPGATAVMAASGAKTQLASAFGALAVLMIVLFAGTLLADLPTATLAAIMIVLSVRIVNVKEIRRIAKYSRTALALAVMTFAAVIVLGVEIGVLIAVSVALISRAVQTSRPEIVELGRRQDGHWLPLAESRAADPSRILVFRLNGPLWFANANWYHDSVMDRLAADPATRAVILDAVTIDDMDYTGASVLKDLVIVMRGRGIDVAVARVRGRTNDSLTRIRLTSALPDDRIFSSVEDAYAALNSLGSRSR